MHEKIIELSLFFCAFFSFVITLGFIVLLGKDALLFFKDATVGFREFFFGTEWQPIINKVGFLPLLNATLMTSVIALLTAAPIGMLSAIFLSEFANRKIRSFLKPTLELLAGIPSVVYGLFAVTFVTPLLRSLFGVDVINIYNNLSAGLVMGVLLLPIITSMVEDALHAVPNSLRYAAYALGANRLQTTLQVIFPTAASGISASLIVGFSRAIGETTIVALAAGAGANFTFNPLEGAETITGYIARISGGDISYDTIDYNSIFVLGFILFLITLGLNLLGQFISQRFGEKYE